MSKILLEFTCMRQKEGKSLSCYRTRERSDSQTPAKPNEQKIHWGDEAQQQQELVAETLLQNSSFNTSYTFPTCTWNIHQVILAVAMVNTDWPWSTPEWGVRAWHTPRWRSGPRSCLRWPARHNSSPPSPHTAPNPPHTTIHHITITHDKAGGGGGGGAGLGWVGLVKYLECWANSMLRDRHSLKIWTRVQRFAG